MLDLGRHGEFVWLSYSFAAVVVILIIAWLLVDGRRYRRQLAELEAQGRGRRSTVSAPNETASAPSRSQAANSPNQG